MKILTISNYFPEHPGGIEFVALNLVSRWRRNHQVRWLACDVTTSPHNSHSDDLPLPSWNFSEIWLGFPYPIPVGKSILNIFKQVKRSDIVHVHDCLYLASIIAFFASSFFSKPIVVTQHIGLIPYKEKLKKVLQILAYRTIGRLILENSNEIIFINRNVKDWFEAKMNLPRTSLIQNGVNRHFFYPDENHEKETIRTKLGYFKKEILLLFVGRFTQKKGVHLIREIAINRPSYHWIMIGSGEVDIHKWNLPNVKVFPPQPQTSLRNFYIAADIFILPSTGEGFPLAVQESLACGLPTAVSEEVANSLPDAPLIQLTISSLSETIKKLDEILSRSDKYTQLQSRSKEFAKQWDWDDTARKYEELFVRVISERSNTQKD